MTTNTPLERRYGVWLHRERIGTLNQKEDFTWFRFTDDYLNDPDRSVLGLTFEEDLTAPHTGTLRLPAWFSNLLPEGRLRDWIASDRGVSADREMELLAQVGRDLPGAVQVLPEDVKPGELKIPDYVAPSQGGEAYGMRETWRFSLAGVGLKFSMKRNGKRLTLPAYGEGGDWIVKFPESAYPGVPRNEYAMMSLAARAGIEVPEIVLIHRDDLAGTPDDIWPSDEEFAYGVRRFDRGNDRELIHIEDFAQVRNIYPYNDRKYQGNFETVAALAYRGYDLEALREFTRRLAFIVLISNGDAHLKNWSLIYRDRRRPTLSPTYDLVSTEFYRRTGHPEDLGLRFGKSRRFDQVDLSLFDRLERKLNAQSANLPQCVHETVERVVAEWPNVADILNSNAPLRDSISRSIDRRKSTIIRAPARPRWRGGSRH
jgi:serine/threonine-protein kinase HipA